MRVNINSPVGTRYQVQQGRSSIWGSRRSSADRTLVLFFLVLAWGIPYPFRLAVEANTAPGLEAALNNVVSTRGVLQILAWAGFALVVWLRVMQIGGIGFLRVFLAQPPGVFWMTFIFVQVISILFSPSPVLCTFRVFQSVVLIGFLVFWFYQEGGHSGSVLIRTFVAFSGTNAIYNIIMYVAYPDAVVAWDPVDGNRLIGGWLFLPDFSGAGLVLFVFCLTSLVYCKENYVFYSIGTAIGATDMVLSATRSVSFSAIAVTCLIPWLRTRNTAKRTMILAGSAIVLLLLFEYATYINQLMGRASQSLEGFDGREEIWTTYLEDFARQGSIAFGLGFQTGGRFLASLHPGTPFGNLHDMYLEALVDLGIAGLFALVGSLGPLLFAAPLLRRWQTDAPISKHDKYACRDLAFCWLSLITILLLGTVSDSLLEENGALGMTMVLMYLLVALYFGRPRIG